MFALLLIIEMFSIRLSEAKENRISILRTHAHANFVWNDINSRQFGRLPKLVIPVSRNQLKQFVYTNVVELRIDIADIMAVQKQNMPSFASIISILSIVFYCAGFLRVELELHEQKKRINALESVGEAKSPSNDADMNLIKNAPGKFFCYKLELTS